MIDLPALVTTANQQYDLLPEHDLRAVVRMNIDLDADSTGRAADAVASRVFAKVSRLLGGKLFVAENFKIADLYPNGLEGTPADQTFFIDDGRRLAEIEFDAPLDEVELAARLSTVAEVRLPIVGGNGCISGGRAWDAECHGIRFIGRQF